MAGSDSDSAGAGLGLGVLLFLVFLTLKLLGKITWSWWLVTAPPWGGLVIFPATLVTILVITALIERLQGIERKNNGKR